MSGAEGFGSGSESANPAPVAGANRRRSERLLLTIPIRVEGVDVKGQPFGENTRTLVINRHGARIQLKHPVAPGTTLKITTLLGHREANFRVIGPTQPVSAEGGEWGVECLDEKGNIWGIGFPPSLPDPKPATALLECRQCHSVSLTPLSLVEHDVLTSAGLLTKECTTCGRLTTWGITEKTAGILVPDQEAEPGIREVIEGQLPGSNRRHHGRVSLRLPTHVRNFFGTEEFTWSENISKTGLCFISEKHYELGEVLLVICPFEQGGHNIEVRSNVVRRRGMQGTNSYIYGIRYEK
jgi:hypothetical protein